MEAKLRCWIGLHRSKRHVRDDAKAFLRCADCRKLRDIPDVAYTSGFG